MDASWHILRGAVAERSDRDQVWERPGRRAQLAFAIRGITRGPERAQGAAAPGPSARAAGWIGHRDGDRDRGAGVARAAPAGEAARPDVAACRAGAGGGWVAVPGPSPGARPASDEETRALAEAAGARGEMLYSGGWPWEPVRFATPDSRGIAAMRLPAPASPGMLAALALGAIAIFTAFGATVLRGAVVRPLERLSRATRAVAAGDMEVRIPEEGVARSEER